MFALELLKEVLDATVVAVLRALALEVRMVGRVVMVRVEVLHRSVWKIEERERESDRSKREFRLKNSSSASQSTGLFLCSWMCAEQGTDSSL